MATHLSCPLILRASIVRHQTRIITFTADIGVMGWRSVKTAEENIGWLYADLNISASGGSFAHVCAWRWARLHIIGALRLWLHTWTEMDWAGHAYQFIILETSVFCPDPYLDVIVVSSGYGLDRETTVALQAWPVAEIKSAPPSAHIHNEIVIYYTQTGLLETAARDVNCSCRNSHPTIEL
jgi:hypothetical protein